jgi:hypothetical protein
VAEESAAVLRPDAFRPDAFRPGPDAIAFGVPGGRRKNRRRRLLRLRSNHSIVTGLGSLARELRRSALVSPRLNQQLAQLFGRALIERNEGFVHQEDIRLHGKRATLDC